MGIISNALYDKLIVVEYYFIYNTVYSVSKFLNSGPQRLTEAYLSFGTDLVHMIDVTESLMIGNENIDQNV